MRPEFADPESSLRMLESAIAATSLSIIGIAILAALLAGIFILRECAGLTRERPRRSPPDSATLVLGGQRVGVVSGPVRVKFEARAAGLRASDDRPRGGNAFEAGTSI